MAPRSGRSFWSRRSAQRFCVRQFEVTGAYLRWEAASASIGLARVAQLGRLTRTQLTCLRTCNAHTCTIIGIRSICTDGHGSSPEQDTPRCSPWPQPLRCWSATTRKRKVCWLISHQPAKQAPEAAKSGKIGTASGRCTTLREVTFIMRAPPRTQWYLRIRLYTSDSTRS